MISFETPGIKEQITEQLQRHYEADEIEKGRYWKDGKGCAVGCILHSDRHVEFETRFGIPEWLARLIDTIFEGLSNDVAKEWPLRVWKAIPEGKDELWFNRVQWQFCLFLQRKNLERVKTLNLSVELKEQVLNAIIQGITGLEAAITTGIFPETARSAAWSAARSAQSAAQSAESAESAAWSAQRAESAQRAVCTRYADELVRLLEMERLEEE